MDSGVFVEGFRIQVHPDAKEGPNLYPTFNSGKFHAKYPTTTPQRLVYDKITKAVRIVFDNFSSHSLGFLGIILQALY